MPRSERSSTVEKYNSKHTDKEEEEKKKRCGLEPYILCEDLVFVRKFRRARECRKNPKRLGRHHKRTVGNHEYDKEEDAGKTSSSSSSRTGVQDEETNLQLEDSAAMISKIENLLARSLGKAVRTEDVNMLQELISEGKSSKEELNNALMTAVGRCSTTMAELLLNAGADANFYNSWCPLLVQAIRRDNQQMVDLLLNHKAKLNVDSASGSAVHAAASLNNVPLLEALLQRGENAACKKSITKMTALMEAALSNSLDAGEFLLRVGVDVNDTDSRKQTALHYAAMKGHEEFIKLLKINGARLNVANKYSHTPLMYALESGFRDVADALCPDDIDDLDRRRETLLLHAVFSGSVPCVQFLMAKGANPNIKNGSGQLPITLAIIHRFKKIAEILAAKTYLGPVDNRHKTPLMHAMLEPYNNEDLWNILKNAGADVNAKSRTGRTLLMTQVRLRKTKKVNWLLKAGADPNLLTPNRKTALWEAARRSCKLTKKLICYNVSMSNTNLKSLHQTPLQLALKSRHPANRAKALLNAGCSLAGINKSRIHEKRFPKLWSYIKLKASHPRTLQEACKISIRESIGFGLGAEAAIRTLEIPKVCKDFLSSAYQDPKLRDLDADPGYSSCDTEDDDSDVDPQSKDA